MLFRACTHSSVSPRASACRSPLLWEPSASSKRLSLRSLLPNSLSATTLPSLFPSPSNRFCSTASESDPRTARTMLSASLRSSPLKDADPPPHETNRKQIGKYVANMLLINNLCCSPPLRMSIGSLQGCKEVLRIFSWFFMCMYVMSLLSAKITKSCISDKKLNVFRLNSAVQQSAK